MEKYNWIDIQKFYDDNHTWRDIILKFNLNNNVLYGASINGLFKSRTKSEAMKLTNKLKPRIQSDETKKKISESRIKYLKNNPDKVPYKLNHYSKGTSYPEKYFDEILKTKNLEYKKELPISIYSLDFAFVEKGIDLEIDGEQHYLDPVIIESNRKRDIFYSVNVIDL